ncbi:NAD(P)-binding domain-containing protein [Streptomyces sp. NBC_00343]|uniref:NAD(P)-binding domain-containing protein n=1 Tax=Streptomyces sp. NBC_00343 TaxID=2975719 RepID=UPI002E291373|nr:hypothetical protein [Streptomyces sp. NBC_00343]
MNEELEPEQRDVPPTIGVLGAGGIAVALATMFARAGHEVRIGGRDEDVVAESSVVIPAALGVQGAVQRLRPWRAGLRGRILVDITNPFTGGHVDFVSSWATGGTPDPSVPDIHVISDDEEAKRTFLGLCAATPFTYVDGGGVDQARRVERMALRGVGSAGVLAA